MIAGLVCALLLTASDASAFFGRCKSRTYQPAPVWYEPCPCPCPPQPPVPPTPTDPNALSEEETEVLHAMLEAGAISEEEAEKLQAMTPDKRKPVLEAFIKDNTPAPPTTDELKQFIELAKAGKSKGGLDAADFITYQGLSPAARRQAYEAYKAVTESPTPEELEQFLQMVAAGKDKGGYTIADLPAYQKLTPAERKKKYDDFKK